MRNARFVILTAAIILFVFGSVSAQSTEFSYQGKLKDGGAPANGNYDFEFALFDALSVGNQTGATLIRNSVVVSDGTFSVKLDFGNQFPGATRYLEIRVRLSGQPGLTILSPRQEVNSEPYSIKTLNADSATSSTQLNGQPASFYQNAANLSSGTLSDLRLSTNVPLLNASNTFSNALNIFSGNVRVTGFQLGTSATAGRVLTVDASGVGTWQTAPVLTLPYTGSGSNPIAGVLNITNTTGPAIQAFGNSGQPGLAAFSADPGAYAVFGRATGVTGNGKGGYFQSFSTSGYGVYANVTATTGANFGVYGESASSGGYGVWGENTDNVGVYGNVTGTTGTNYGVYGNTPSSSGTGVRGRATSTTGVNYGGFFATNSTTGYGVYASANGATGVNYGVYGESSSTSGYGVYGINTDNIGVRGSVTGTTGTNYGVYGTSASTGGYGVFGSASGTSGLNRGGYFQTVSTGGRAVEGANLATSGNNYGGYFFTNSSSGTGAFASGGAYGLYAISDSTTGQGVYGVANAGTGTTTGVYGESNSTSGFGVFGTATSTSGTTYGVRGESSSTANGRGVFGFSPPTTGDGWGVYGRSNGNYGVGVRGYAASTATSNALPIGVFGEVTGDLGYGVYGLGDYYGTTGRFNNPVSGFGVFSFGTSGASGAKTFRIDHPIDPANKYLMHYATESPEVINFYSGKITLDANGEAVVNLPAYFASINKDPRYTLTAIGSAMPMLHVAVEIDEASLNAGAKAGPGVTPPACSFRIAGGVAGGKVSWRIEAVRNDEYMRRYGTPVEIEKPDSEKGKYQHPEFYGQPATMRVDYKPTNEAADDQPVKKQEK